MALVERYTDPDVVGGLGDGTSWANAYSSMNAWEAAEQTDLVTATDTHIVYCRASSGTADTTALGLDGWTTNATYFVTVQAASGDESVKTGWDTNRYRLDTTDNLAIRIGQPFTVYDGIQTRNVYSATNFRNAIQVSGSLLTSGAEVTIKNCYVTNGGSGATYRGIVVNDADVTAYIENNIVYNALDNGILLQAGTALLYNNTVYGSGADNIYSNAGTTITCKNNVSGNSPDDFDLRGTATVDYNISDDGDGTNAQTPSGSDWTNELNSPSTGDMTALTGGNLENNGVGPSSDSNVPTTDIDGTSRSGTSCDIGADEIAGGTTYQVACADGISTTDATPGQADVSAAGVDGITLSDSATAVFTFITALSDGVTFSDTSTEGGGQLVQVSCADGILTTDAATGNFTFNGQCTDGVSLSDIINAVVTFNATAADGVTFTDIAVESSQLIGKLTITLTSKQGSITLTASQPGISMTSKQPGIDMTGS
jgi:hypothetical protein